MSQPGAGVLAWCTIYTAAAPVGQRLRRREEIRSHVWETYWARGAGWRTRLHLLLACGRGAVADLAWCNDVRRAEGMSPLVAGVLVGRVGATAIAAVLIISAYLSALVEGFLPVFDGVREVTGLVAAAFVIVSVSDRLLSRRRNKKEA